MFADVLELQCDPASQLSMGISDICRKLRNPGHTGIVCCASHAGPQEALWGLSAYINHTGTSRPLVFPSVQALTRKETQFPSFFIGILKAVRLFIYLFPHSGWSHRAGHRACSSPEACPSTPTVPSFCYSEELSSGGGGGVHVCEALFIASHVLPSL